MAAIFMRRALPRARPLIGPTVSARTFFCTSAPTFLPALEKTAFFYWPQSFPGVDIYVHRTAKPLSILAMARLRRRYLEKVGKLARRYSLALIGPARGPLSARRYTCRPEDGSSAAGLFVGAFVPSADSVAVKLRCLFIADLRIRARHTT